MGQYHRFFLIVPNEQAIQTKPRDYQKIRSFRKNDSKVNMASEIPVVKSLAARWYRNRTTSKEDNNSILLRPFYACRRCGAHIHLAKSAFRPVLSSQTEKFAQLLMEDEDLHVERRF
ncbi:hypothetical protein FBUS_09113 [Fasciolopsis buskii]|uniref:Uncharacterized protein n=1 Tax=Fasciolopsis buskii TaxID=27845 RepID=A0A8E0VND2_9TREM|nr:hypothetical protein FBUS_09113 [Fasciolopsis buski]